MKRMTYETYAYLKYLIETREQKLDLDFQTAINFIPSEMPKRGQSGLEKAHDIYRKEWRRLQDMREELHDAAACTYKDHPNPEMRKFWGLKE